MPVLRDRALRGRLAPGPRQPGAGRGGDGAGDDLQDGPGAGVGRGGQARERGRLDVAVARQHPPGAEQERQRPQRPAGPAQPESRPDQQAEVVAAAPHTAHVGRGLAQPRRQAAGQARLRHPSRAGRQRHLLAGAAEHQDVELVRGGGGDELERALQRRVVADQEAAHAGWQA